MFVCQDTESDDEIPEPQEAGSSSTNVKVLEDAVDGEQAKISTATQQQFEYLAPAT